MAEEGTLSKVMKFFGFTKKDGTNDVPAFRKEWGALTDTDKAQIKQGIEDGSLDY